MIANLIGMTPSFHGAVSYNLRGHDGTKLDKCAWWTLRNVPGDDPELGATMMEATARLSSRVQTPAFHFSIDWHKDEQPTREMSRKAAEAVLARLGLADHQSIIFCHQDAAHPHIHLVVNRVHPESGKAWAHWKSKERLERAVRETARELGFWAIEGRHEAERSTTERKSRGAYRRDGRLRSQIDGEARWASHARVERVFAARNALHAYEFGRAARAFRFQRKRVRAAASRREALRSRYVDLLAKRRAALWSGLGAVLTGRSAKKKDNEAKRLELRIATAEKQLALAHSRLTAEQKLLATRRENLDAVKSRAGDRAERKAKRQELTEALRAISPGDLRAIKLPRRERQQLMAMMKSAKDKKMETYRSSAYLIYDIKRKEKHLKERVEVERKNRQSERDNAWYILEKWRYELEEMNGNNKDAVVLMKKIADKEDQFKNLEKDLLEIIKIKENLLEEIGELNVELEKAKEREKKEREQER